MTTTPINEGKPKPRKLLTPTQTGEYLGLPTTTLDQWRSQKKGPPFFKLEGHLIRYSLSDLDVWLAEQRVSTESLKKGG